MATYVVKSWYADQKMNPHGQYVSIKGRAPGLISWVLSLLGVSPTVSLQCGCNNFVYEAGSLSGKQVKTIPLSKISSVYYGYAKPWKQALAIALIGVTLATPFYAATQSGLASAFIILVCLALGFAYYLLNKDFSIGVCEVGGIVSGIDFRRSLIEGVTVDEGAAEKVHLIIQALVERVTNKHSS